MLTHLTITTLLALSATSLLAEISERKHQGKIRVLGNHVNRTIIISSEGGDVSICPKSSYFATLNTLNAMTVSVEGVEERKKKRSCLNVQKLDVVETSTGKRPVIGTLIQKEQGYFLKIGEDELEVKPVLPGLADHVGKRVMVAIDKKIELQATKTLNIHSYMSFPTQD